jgi:ADP-heptose:LPS heptosyltransferase
VQDLGLTQGDLGDLAVVIQQMDLVIGVDTPAVHLAGALGKPVWTLLGHRPHWRWMLEGESSPWYPTMRLFRQRRPDDWDDVVDRVARALNERRWEETG